MDQQSGDFGCIPSSVVQDDEHERDVIPSSDPVDAFHLGKEGYAIAHTEGCQKHYDKSFGRYSHGTNESVWFS